MAKGSPSANDEESVAELRREIETLKEKLSEEKQKLNDIECTRTRVIIFLNRSILIFQLAYIESTLEVEPTLVYRDVFGF